MNNSIAARLINILFSLATVVAVLGGLYGAAAYVLGYLPSPFALVPPTLHVGESFLYRALTNPTLDELGLVGIFIIPLSYAANVWIYLMAGLISAITLDEVGNWILTPSPALQSNK